MRLLIIGNVSPYFSRLSAALIERAWHVQIAGIDEIVSQDGYHFDAIVVDDKSSLSALPKTLRKSPKTLLVLLGEGGEAERSNALNLGFHDVIQRDVPPSLIAARLGALLRLLGGAIYHEYRVGDLTVDIQTRRVRRNDQDILLSQREFQMLILMMQNVGSTLMRSTIIEKLWPNDYSINSNTVDALASRLRRKIDGGAKPLIHTLRGIGYSIQPHPTHH